MAPPTIWTAKVDMLLNTWPLYSKPFSRTFTSNTSPLYFLVIILPTAGMRGSCRISDCIVLVRSFGSPFGTFFTTFIFCFFFITSSRNTLPLTMGREVKQNKKAPLITRLFYRKNIFLFAEIIFKRRKVSFAVF